MTELQEINKLLIENAIPILDKLFSWVKGEVKTRDLLGKAARKYGESFIDRYNTLKILGMREPVSLKDIYVRVNILEKITSELHLTPEKMNELHMDFIKRGSLGKIEEKSVEGLQLANRKQYLTILGQPGGGKTTYLKHIGIQSLCGKLGYNCIPVFISLKELADSGEEVLEFMAKEFDTCGLPEAESFISYKLENGNFLLLLDGLDEVDKEKVDKICRDVNNFCDKYSQNRFIISCRTAAYNWTFKRFTDVELDDFSTEQITSFINQWFRENKVKAKACEEKLFMNENKPILELAQTPLLLTLLCLSFDESMDFPSNRAELYKDSMEALLRKWDTSRNIAREKIYKHLSHDRKIGMFSRIANQSFEKGRYFIRQDDLEQQIADFIKNLPEAQKETIKPDSQIVLKAIEAHHGILVERAHSVYSFSHLTFQEYFTARYMVDNSRHDMLRQLIKNHLTDVKWREVFLLCAGMLSESDDFLKDMKQEADGIIQDEGLRRSLSWVRDKADSVKVKHKPAAVRSFYTSFVCTVAFDLVNNLDSDVYLAPALDLDLDRDLVASARDYDARDFDHVLARAQQMGLTSLTRALKELKHQLPQEGAPKEAWSDWAEKLREVMIRERNIGHQFELNKEQVNCLNDYLYANQLIVDCLNSQCYVSTEVREDILNNLLLPPDL